MPDETDLQNETATGRSCYCALIPPLSHIIAHSTHCPPLHLFPLPLPPQPPQPTSTATTTNPQRSTASSPSSLPFQAPQWSIRSSLPTSPNVIFGPLYWLRPPLRSQQPRQNLRHPLNAPCQHRHLLPLD
ncbi:hypothetical protein BGZ63DRAFT_201047 [Mariannaea sp. PMI_226]|nr:hypothetical protein BGZ63DRAFT_201047 [Mariannaea sp. PMI_226]